MAPVLEWESDLRDAIVHPATRVETERPEPREKIYFELELNEARPVDNRVGVSLRGFRWRTRRLLRVILRKVVSRLGIEPRTRRLRVCCSAS